MKTFFRFFACLGFLPLLLFTSGGCSDDGPSTDERIDSVEQLNHSGIVIGGVGGSAQLAAAMRKLPQAEISQFMHTADAVAALKSGRVAGVAGSRPVLEYTALNQPELFVLPDNLSTGGFAVAAPVRNRGLLVNVNEFIRRCGGDGTSAAMRDRWFHTKDPLMPNIPEPSNPDALLIVGTECLNEPMSFLGADGTVSGFDIEFIRRLAAALNLKCEIKILDRNALLPALASGKIDLAVAALNPTGKTNRKVLYSIPYVAAPTALLVRTVRNGAAGASVAIDSRMAVTDINQLTGCKIGVVAASATRKIVEQHFPDCQPVIFSGFSELLAALRDGRISAFLAEEPVARHLAAVNADVAIPGRICNGRDYALVFPRSEEMLSWQFNAVLREMKRDGSLAKLRSEWLDDNGDAKMPVAAPPVNGVLKFATAPELAPYTYLRDGKCVGYDLAVASHIAARLGYRIEFVPVKWSQLFDTIAGGTVRVGGGGVAITDERRGTFVFSDPIDCADIVAVALKPDRAATLRLSQRLYRTGSEVCEIFERTFGNHGGRLLLRGIGVTFGITAAAAVLGALLAVPLCLLMRVRSRWINCPVHAAVAIIRGIPFLLLLLIMTYSVFSGSAIGAVYIAVIAFALRFAADLAGSADADLDAVPVRQLDEARALGLGEHAIFRHVVLPETLRRLLPEFGRELVIMFEATSVVGYISIQDLTRVSDILRGRSGEAFLPLVAAGSIYFLTAFLLARLFSKLAAGTALRRRKRTIGGVVLK